MDDEYLEVMFGQYCQTCKHETEDTDYDSICDKCLSEPVNLYSHKPIKWEAK